jgi:carboxypeptidase T
MPQLSSLAKTTLLILTSIFCFNTVFAQQKEKYSRAKITLDAKEHTMMQLSELGMAVDHGDYRKGKYFTSDFSETELRTIRNAGFKVEVLIDDVTKFYQEQVNQPAPQKKTSAVPCDTIGKPGHNIPTHFHLGTYAGGHYNYLEFRNQLDSMRIYYPGLISTRQQVDTFRSIEGRPIEWVRVSNNPMVNQPLKPQMLFTSLHHAREPGSLTATIYFLWYLLENYNTDPRIKAIVDNTELYFIPLVNPDGYFYNIANAPGGGGMWRKNRRLITGSTYGVDLNRNYGYLFGYDNVGSSNTPTSDVYRGPSAFSERETKAIKWFSEQHQFKLGLNYHTYNNEVLNPFGHVQVAYPVDSFQFTAYSLLFTRYNFYRYGTCFQCLGYVANGDANDWMYADLSTKNKILAWTPEIGSVQFGFYPPAYQTIPDCQAVLSSNLDAAALLLPYGKISTEDPAILTTANGHLHYRLQSLGTATGVFTVTAQSLNTRLTINATPKVHTNPNLLQIIVDSLSYTIDNSTGNNQSLKYILKVNNGYYDVIDTIEFYYGKYSSVTTPSMVSFTNWINNGWSLNTINHFSAPSSFKSSPTAGNYPDASSLTLQLKDTVNLTKAVRAYLQFYTRWDIEPKNDYLTVDVTETGTGTWNTLCGRFTKPGDYNQPFDVPVYDDHQYDWLLEEMDLGAYLGKKIQLRFDLETDPDLNYDGFYFDDIRVVTVMDSVAASVPGIIEANSVSVYPNPAHTQLTININNVNNTGVQAILYDCFGRQVKALSITDTKTIVDISTLAPGIYFLKLFTHESALPVQKIEIVR